jgi:hypothetical protein
MSEAYRTYQAFGAANPDIRNRFHETALREARMATEYRHEAPLGPDRPGFLGRLRLAFDRPVSAEARNCPA